MPRIAANLTMLFTEYPTLERFERAAAAGFTGVELLYPYTESIEAVQRAAADAGVELVLINLPSGNWAEGERGIAALIDRTEEFANGVQEAVRYADVLRPSRINCLSGKVEAGTSLDVLASNIRLAADALEKIGVVLTVEPVNDIDVPGFALPNTQVALDVIAASGATNVALQFDVYHALRKGEDPLAFIAANGPTIGHIQVADIPGRHQPGTGEIDWPTLFATIDDSGYSGWVGLEYIPEGATEDGFGLVRELGLLGS